MPMTGAPDLGREVHHLAHLLGHHLAEAAAEDGEVLGEDEDGAAVDRAVAGDDGVAPGPALLHLELVGPVADEGVELLEGTGVEQLLDPLAGGHLALGVLLFHRGLGGGVDRLLAQLAQVGELLFVGDRVALAHCGRGVYSGRSARGERPLLRLGELLEDRLHVALLELASWDAPRSPPGCRSPSRSGIPARPRPAGAARP